MARKSPQSQHQIDLHIHMYPSKLEEWNITVIPKPGEKTHEKGKTFQTYKSYILPARGTGKSKTCTSDAF